MKILLSIAAMAAVMFDGAGAAAAEVPTFELMGFPITRHQVAVLGAAHVQERSPTPTLTLGSMPASPHQVGRLDTASENNRRGVGFESDQSWLLAALDESSITLTATTFCPSYHSII